MQSIEIKFNDFESYETPELIDLGSILGETANSCSGGNNCTFGGR